MDQQLPVDSQRERYFMTTEEQDQQLGRAIREHGEAVQNLGRLRAKAADLGNMLSDLGNELQKYPAFVIFQRESHDSRFSSERHPLRGSRPQDMIFSADAIDGKSIVALVSAIQGAEIKVADLKRRLEALGHKV